MKEPRFGIVMAVVLLTSIVCWPSVALSDESAPTGYYVAPEQPPGSDAEGQPADAGMQSVGRTEELLQALAAAGTIPSELQDPAFDRYVDLALLGSAWADLDAALMTDVLLQFMEGERVLLRPHKAVDTNALMEVAVRLATLRGDRQSLDRLEKAGKLRGSGSLATQIAEARKTLAQVKPADPAQTISIESLTAEDFALYKACLLDIDAAVIAQDAHALDVLEEELSKSGNLPEEHRAKLQEKIKAARKSLSDNAQQPSAAANVLDKLAATTRSGWQLGPDAGTLEQGGATTPGVGIIEPGLLDVDDGIRQGGPNRPDNPTYPGNPPGTLIPPAIWTPPGTWRPPHYPPGKRPYYPPYYPPQQQQQQWIPRPPRPPQPPSKWQPPQPPGKWHDGGFSRRYYIVE
jgi:hypothetical protein